MLLKQLLYTQYFSHNNGLDYYLIIFIIFEKHIREQAKEDSRHISMDCGEKRSRDDFVAEETAVVKRRALRVNDVLTLRFVGANGTDINSVHPTYTHQIFENECVALFEPSQPHLDVTIRLQDLYHHVEIRGVMAESEKEHLIDKLDHICPNFTCTNICPGRAIREFEVDSDKFVITLATHEDSGAASLLRSCEKLAMWFIETADSVDFSDNRWEAIFVHRKDFTSHSDEFVGYMTLFTFNNPVVGSKLRVCQALVLPPFQKKGIGRKMLRTVYDMACSRGDVAEVTVEDPAPGFQAMRDGVDVEWILQNSEFISSIGPSIMTPALFSADISVVSLVRYLKLTKVQVEFAIEALQYIAVVSSLDKQSAAADTKSDVDIPDLKRWRLDIKRKILKKHPELSKLPKAEMQTELEEFYNEKVERIFLLKSNRYLKELLPEEAKSFFASSL